MRNFRFYSSSCGLAALLTLGSMSSAYGSGFALIEVNATGQGNAYAGASAYTNNASTIFFNPAGMMNLDGQELVLAAHYIEPSSDFNNDGSTLAPAFAPATISGEDDDGGSGAFVPNLYWAKPLEGDMTFGFGVNTPFGLKTEYDDEWVGRYHGVLSDLKTININPSLGYRVNDKLSIGGGVNVMLAEVDLTSAIDMGALCLALAAATCGPAGVTPGTLSNDGFADLEGDNFNDLGLGFNFGLLYAVSNNTTIGVSYRSEIDLEVEGDADFSLPEVTDVASGAVAGVIGADPLMRFTDTGLQAEVTLPASFSVSLAHRVGKITWLADATWTGWSSFDELRIEFDNPNQPDAVTTEDWDDTMRYSFGFDYQYSDKLVLRAGLALDETPVPSAERRTPRLPGNDREWISFGLTYIATKQLTFDFGYSHLFIDDAKIDNEFESSVPVLNATLTGEYEAEVDILSAQLNWKFE